MMYSRTKGKPLSLVIGKLGQGSFVVYLPSMKLFDSNGCPEQGLSGPESGAVDRIMGHTLLDVTI